MNNLDLTFCYNKNLLKPGVLRINIASLDCNSHTNPTMIIVRPIAL